MIANFFDIETAPLCEEQLRADMPQFEPAKNLKDPEKIKADILEKEQRYIREAALNPITGSVLCVGILRYVPATGRMVFTHLEGEEEVILEQFWGMFSTGEFDQIPWVGFNTKGFDLPFLIQRSWHRRVALPQKLFHGRYFSARFIDLMEVWQCFSRRHEFVSLDRLARFLGIGSKNGSGADFAKLWVENKPMALEYLQNDLSLIQQAAEVMGVERLVYRKEDEQEAA